MNKYECWAMLGLVGVLVLLVAVKMIDMQLSDIRYYDCVYAIKGASVSPADIQVICGR